VVSVGVGVGEVVVVLVPVDGSSGEVTIGGGTTGFCEDVFGGAGLVLAGVLDLCVGEGLATLGVAATAKLALVALLDLLADGVVLVEVDAVGLGPVMVGMVAVGPATLGESPSAKAALCSSLELAGAGEPGLLLCG
jgi:hypothetical protein